MILDASWIAGSYRNFYVNMLNTFSIHTGLSYLLESYYKGIRSSQLSSKDTTKYRWGFAKKIGEEDLNKVEAIRDSIDTMTNIRFAQEVSRRTGKSTASSSDSTSKRTLGPSLPLSVGPQGPSRRPMTADEGNPFNTPPEA